MVRLLAGAAIATLMTSCWTGAVPAPAPPSPATPRAATADREVLEAAVGAFDTDAVFTRDVPVRHVSGALFGWRIKLPCSNEAITYDETITLPGPGEWSVAEGATVSDDQSSARATERTVCSQEGWIEKVWGVADDDPIGRYTITVKVNGFRAQVFQLDVIAP